MTEKRFVLQDLDILCRVLDNGKPINGIETVHLLNKFYEENEQLKEDVERCHNNFSVLDEVKCEIAEENEQLKSRVDYLERKIQRERASAMKQHEKWEKELQE